MFSFAFDCSGTYGMVLRALEVFNSARPHLPLVPRAILEAMVLSERPIGSAETVASRLGLKNRFQLARLLRRHGLPPLHRLAGWVTILSWVLKAEETGASLSAIAFHSQRHPSACDRLVKEITGRRWVQVLAQGSAWIQRAMLIELQGRQNRN